MLTGDEEGFSHKTRVVEINSIYYLLVVGGIAPLIGDKVTLTGSASNFMTQLSWWFPMLKIYGNW